MIVQPREYKHRIYGYVRVSTQEQCRSGVSIDQQKQLITNFSIAKYNRAIDEWFVDDGVSGTTDILERPASRAMTDVIEEHDVVIATRLDRFSRSAQDLLSTIPILEDIGIQLFFCEQFGDMPVVHKKRPKVHGLDQRFDMNDMVNKIMLMVLSAVAEIEHANIRDRFGEGKMDWASRGYYIGGGVPYGWRTEEEKHGNKKRVRLVEVPEEQEWIDVIHKLRKRGRGYKYIAKELNSLQNEKDWHYRQVEKVLKPRKYQAVSAPH